MSFDGVKTNKIQGGLVRGGDAVDRVICLVCGGSTTAKLASYVPTELLSIEDLEALLITDATDLSKKELTHYHVSEIFRLSPETKVHLMVVPKTEKVSTLVAKAEFIAGIRSIEGVNTIGVAGLTADTDATVAIKATQLFVDALSSEYIYLDSVILEGIAAYVPASLSTLTDLRAQDSENVSMIIAQDPAIATKDAAFASHAAVGSALGMLAVRSVHENLGSVDIENHPATKRGTPTYPLTDVKLGRWNKANLSNGVSLSTLSMTAQKNITEKGYIFAGSFNGFAGYYFSNSCTCTLATSAYAYIEQNAVWNKAARLIRNTMLPRVRSKVEADPTTGYIKSTTISYWDGLIRKAMEQMISVKDIASFDIYIDPKQAAVSTKPFTIKVNMVADGVVNEFSIDLGFTNKI